MKKFKLSSFLPLSYILLLVLVSPLYDVLNKSTVHAVDVTTVVDDWIPFVKAFIIPYLIWFPYLYGALIYYCFADRKQYYVTLSSIILGKLACFLFIILANNCTTSNRRWNRRIFRTSPLYL